MGFSYKKLVRYLLNRYLIKYKLKYSDIKDIQYLIGLLDVLELTKFEENLLGFNADTNYIHAPDANMEKVIFALVQITSALDNRNAIFRELVQRDDSVVPFKNFLTNKNNQQLSVQQSMKVLTQTLKTFTTSFKKAQGDQDQINKTNVFLLTQYIEKLSVLVENILTVQLNSK